MEKAPKFEKKFEKKPAEDISVEAEEILSSAEKGVPAFVTQKLEKVALENGIEITSKSTPNEIIEKLKQKKELYKAEEANRITNQIKIHKLDIDHFKELIEDIKTGKFNPENKVRALESYENYLQEAEKELETLISQKESGKQLAEFQKEKDIESVTAEKTVSEAEKIEKGPRPDLPPIETMAGEKSSEKEIVNVEKIIEEAKEYIKADDLKKLRNLPELLSSEELNSREAIDKEKVKKSREDNKIWNEAYERRENFIKILTNSGIGREKATKIYESELVKVERIESEKTAELLGVLNKQGEKIDAEIKEKPNWIREKIEKTADWYKKQALWKKVLFSVGCVGAASASAAVGGAVGTAIATAAITGKLGQRMLGGLATFITAEGMLKKAAEKGGKERTKAEAIRHTVEAATLGILVGSGAAAQAVKELSGFIGDSYHYWFPKTEAIKAINLEQAGQIKPVVAPESFVETAHKGSSVWKMAEHQLESHYGEKFSHLNEAQKTYLIDAIKDKVAANPAKFGLENVDQLKAGQKIDFSEIFNDEEAGKLLGKAGHLSAGQLEQINHNNESIRSWVKSHPGEKLTSDKVRDILGGKATIHTLGGDHYFVNEPGTDRILSVSEGKMTVMETAEVKNDVLINEWLNKTVRIDIKSGWFEYGNFLKNHTMKEVLSQDFIKWKEAPITAPFAQPEYGNPSWWEIHDKQLLQNQLEKLLRKLPVSERAQYQNIKIYEFLERYMKMAK